MSAKDLLYGVVATVVPDCTGVDGGTYTGYIVQKSHFGGTVLGHSIKNVTFVPGDVVRIIQCGECLTYGGTDVPLHGWGFLPYSSACPSVLQIPEYSLVRDIENNQRHEATASLNWLCRKAGCVDKLYWPARITAISGSLVTVCDQFGDGSYQMPVSSDLSISDFSVDDYVLVYSPSSGEEVIGWWMMEPEGNKYWIYEYTAPIIPWDGSWDAIPSDRPENYYTNTYWVTFNSGTTPIIDNTNLALVTIYSELYRFWCQNDLLNYRPSYAFQNGNTYQMQLYVFAFPPGYIPLRNYATYYPESIERLYIPKPSNGWNTLFPFTITIGGTHTITINSSSEGIYQKSATIPGIDPQS